jgi:hypothetical protein
MRSHRGARNDGTASAQLDAPGVEIRDCSIVQTVCFHARAWINWASTRRIKYSLGLCYLFVRKIEKRQSRFKSATMILKIMEMMPDPRSVLSFHIWQCYPEYLRNGFNVIHRV